MAKIIEKPPIYNGNTYERLDQLRDYLFRIADEINDLERSIISNGGSSGSSGGGGTVDQALNINSANAVANAAVTRALNGKVGGNELAAVGRTGDYNDLINKPVIPPSAGVDTAMSDTSENAVQNKVIKAYVDGHIPATKTKLSQFIDDLGSTPTHTHSQYLTEHQSLSGYATQTWVGQQGYLTQHQSLEGYATEQWVEGKDYATEEWVEDQGYLTEHQSLAGYVQTTDSRLSDARTPLPHNHDDRYYTETETNALLAAKVKEPNAEGTSGQVLATDGTGGRYWKTVEGGGGGGGTDDYDELVNKPKINNIEMSGNKTGAELGLASSSDIPTALSELVDDLGSSPVHTHSQYLTEHQSLAGYATQQWVNGRGFLTEHQSLEGYATEDWVEDQGYLTEHQSLAGYATQSWVQQRGYAEDADLATVAKSGSYNDLTDKPTIPESVKEYKVVRKQFADFNVSIYHAGVYYKDVSMSGWNPIGVVGVGAYNTYTPASVNACISPSNNQQIYITISAPLESVYEGMVFSFDILYEKQ